MKTLFLPLLFSLSLDLSACPLLEGSYSQCQGTTGSLKIPLTISVGQSLNEKQETLYHLHSKFADGSVSEVIMVAHGQEIRSEDNRSSHTYSCLGDKLTSLTIFPQLNVTVMMDFFTEDDRFILEMKASGMSQTQDKVTCFRE